MLAGSKGCLGLRSILSSISITTFINVVIDIELRIDRKPKHPLLPASIQILYISKRVIQDLMFRRHYSYRSCVFFSEKKPPVWSKHHACEHSDSRPVISLKDIVCVTLEFPMTNQAKWDIRHIK